MSPIGAADPFDKYLFEAQPGLLREVAEAMVALLPECDALAGMEMGGIRRDLESSLLA
ncbi:orotate phosphoribosyltransferase [Micromonospora profundi]|uniref:hypothetical protein n=1 Tax=Micromonospora profundi TaxID=1420889 RepID=UPI0016976AF1|nr:hypothetical protein [Micromonospora profundi]NJC14016.1 orotate phosphoribosyltransferase [Micromonospora profundi]